MILTSLPHSSLSSPAPHEPQTHIVPKYVMYYFHRQRTRSLAQQPYERFIGAGLNPLTILRRKKLIKHLETVRKKGLNYHPS